MAENSKIEWTDHTFNPWLGCTKISPGCQHCYAEAMMDKRYGRVKWGLQGTRQRTSEANWRKPLKWNRQAEREGRQYKVFCGSLCDVFEGNDQLLEWRWQLWDLIAQTPNLDWLLLTKRPENALRMTPWQWRGSWKEDYTDYGNRLIGAVAGQPAEEFIPNPANWPANVWLGASIENQQTADERIPKLVSLPPAVRFLSIEPLLGPVDISWWLKSEYSFGGNVPVRGSHKPAIDWVITGGESGRAARPFHLEWAKAIIEQCRAAGMPVFIKQLGANPIYQNQPYPAANSKGGHPDEWPGGLQVREFPLVALQDL